MVSLLPKDFPLSDFIEVKEDQQVIFNTLAAYEFLVELQKAGQWPNSWPLELDDVGRQLRDLLNDTCAAMYGNDSEDNPKGTLTGVLLEDLQLVFADPSSDRQLIMSNQVRASLGIPGNCMLVRAYAHRVVH